MFAFVNSFSLNEKKIIKMSSDIKMELVDLKTNSILKTKSDELPSHPGASEISVSGDPYPVQVTQN